MSLETSDNHNDLSGSVGLVKPKKVVIEQPLKLACGVTLPSHTLAYETYGSLNKDNTNAILICHALSGNHHAAQCMTDKDGISAVSYTHLTLPTILLV